jgi:membrane AbrB-like protein
MENEKIRIVITLVIGFTGAMAATWAEWPAAALIGSSVAVTAVALAKFATTVPAWIRNMAFAAIGCSLGSGIRADIFDLVVKWPISILALGLTVIAILFFCSWLLVAFFGQSRETAILAVAPGALSYSLALAAEGRGDLRMVLVIQCLRLLLITTALPLLLDLGDPIRGGAAGGTVACMSLTVTILVFLGALAIGYCLDRVRFPAAYLLAGVVVSGIAHYFAITSGRPQPVFLFLGFSITGTVIGARFSSIPREDLQRYFWAVLVVFAVSSGLAASVAILVARTLGLPFGQVWIAYAPGGVEAMAAMAMAFHYDSTYVATHHLCRIFGLIFLLPVLLRFFAGKNSGSVR